MSEEQLKVFLEKLKSDTSLQEKLKAMSDVDEILAFAKEAGYEITVEDIKKASQASDQELENASGGYDCGGMCCVMGFSVRSTADTFG
jgi:predicted ribosomally synthesized peptide with nif11-like leader